MEHGLTARPQAEGSSSSANIPDMSLGPRRRGRPIKEIPKGMIHGYFLKCLLNTMQ